MSQDVNVQPGQVLYFPVLILCTTNSLLHATDDDLFMHLVNTVAS